MSWKVLVGFFIFYQTYTNDEYIKFWVQKVKVQGHGGITYAGTVTAQVVQSRVEFVFPVFTVIFPC